MKLWLSRQSQQPLALSITPSRFMSQVGGGSLGHFTCMRILPANLREWLNVIAIPFKTLLFAYGCYYPFGFFLAPRFPGMIYGPDNSLLEPLINRGLTAFPALLGLAFARAGIRNRRAAAWNLVFAFLALFFGVGSVKSASLQMSCQLPDFH